MKYADGRNFYAKAKDADYIIYNSTIDGENLRPLMSFFPKVSFLQIFKAVKNGKCLVHRQKIFSRKPPDLEP